MSDRETDRIAGPEGKLAGTGRVRSKRGLTEDGHVEELINMKDAAYAAEEAHRREVKEALERTEDLQKRAQESWDTIDYLLSHIPESTREYLAFVKEALATTRDQRMALQSETRSLLSSLREVREFFLEDKHETEIKRLLEFVDLCERLQRLKTSGFLDTITETIIRLS